MLLFSRDVAGKPKAAVSIPACPSLQPFQQPELQMLAVHQYGALACSAGCQVLGCGVRPWLLSLHPAQMQGLSFHNRLLADFACHSDMA